MKLILALNNEWKSMNEIKTYENHPAYLASIGETYSYNVCRGMVAISCTTILYYRIIKTEGDRSHRLLVKQIREEKLWQLL